MFWWQKAYTSPYAAWFAVLWLIVINLLLICVWYKQLVYCFCSDHITYITYERVKRKELAPISPASSRKQGPLVKQDIKKESPSYYESHPQMQQQQQQQQNEKESTQSLSNTLLSIPAKEHEFSPLPASNVLLLPSTYTQEQHGLSAVLQQDMPEQLTSQESNLAHSDLNINKLSEKV
ncbi:hypothetical protein RFI_34838, partial [Reticulomyxa filosa]